MQKRFKNILVVIKRVYNFLVSIVYKETQPANENKGFDSRKIPPPRIRNDTERCLFSSASRKDTGIPYIFSYSNSHAHSTIYWFKYKRDAYTTELLCKVLVDEILGIISDRLDARSNVNSWIITPAPSTSFELGLKNWDHNQDLVTALKKHSDFSFMNIFGLTDKNIKLSKKLNKHERQNLTNKKFFIFPEAKIPQNTGLIIFDDVTTTGSTLNSLKVLAEKLKPKIILMVAIAH